MGKTGRFVLLLGVVCILMSFFAAPLQAMICDHAYSWSGGFCKFMGGLLSLSLLPIGGVMVVAGLVLSVLPW